jgi:hypothetical protein
MVTFFLFFSDDNRLNVSNVRSDIGSVSKSQTRDLFMATILTFSLITR